MPEFENAIVSYMFMMDRNQKLTQRSVPHILNALANIGGLFDIVTLIFGLIYWFFAEPINELAQAIALARMKESSQAPEYSLGLSLKWFAFKRLLCNCYSPFEELDSLLDQLQLYLSLENLVKLSQRANISYTEDDEDFNKPINPTFTQDSATQSPGKPNKPSPQTNDSYLNTMKTNQSAFNTFDPPDPLVSKLEKPSTTLVDHKTSRRGVMRFRRHQANDSNQTRAQNEENH